MYSWTEYAQELLNEAERYIKYAHENLSVDDMDSAYRNTEISMGFLRDLTNLI